MRLCRHCPPHRRAWTALAALCAGLAIGCASPGPPRPPSLHLPEPVKDLAAQRSGDTVELTFSTPLRSTDKEPLRGPTVHGILCREVEHQGCVTVAGVETAAGAAKDKAKTPGPTVTLQDALPSALAHGPQRLLTYRVQFFNATGRSAGWSDAAYTVAGAAPAQVEALKVEGSRLGVVLRWKPHPGEPASVLLERTETAPHAPAPSEPAGRKKAASGVVWLETHAVTGGFEGDETLDDSAEPEVAYKYVAVRQATVTMGGRTIEVRSEPSAPVLFTLHAVYPPPVPTGLNVAGFTSADGVYAVDLIWQPVDSPGLAGYNIYRSRGEGTREKLNPAPLTLPAFHDGSARASESYQYAVTAVDAKGNESEAVTALLQHRP